MVFIFITMINDLEFHSDSILKKEKEKTLKKFFNYTLIVNFY